MKWFCFVVFLTVFNTPNTVNDSGDESEYSVNKM